MEKSDYRHLALFLGPKAENAALAEEMLLLILRDYVHWRRNYFPGDPMLITASQRRDLEAEHDALAQHVQDLMALLRRNFPFYSPRYIAHELSDTLLPAMLGYFAGMLFNANNVTPEAAPVTTYLEVEACSALLAMLGFNPPPPLPPKGTDPRDYYGAQTRSVFGWAHLCSGGTVANIEALWIARQVRYFPLAAKRVAEKRKLSLLVKRPNDTEGGEIRSLSDRELLLIKPNEAIYLLSRLVDAVRVQEGLPFEKAEEAARLTWAELAECPLSLSNGAGRVFAEHPPVVFVTGTRHYSIGKAADIIGLGHRNIVRVDTDDKFRMDPAALELAIRRSVEAGRVPLAVILAAGTTEEGAVDPIHEVMDLRARLERENISFWIHIDAAWGGFIRSLFSFTPEDRFAAVTSRIGSDMGIPDALSMVEWHKGLENVIRQRLKSHPEEELRLAFDENLPLSDRGHDRPDGDQSDHEVAGSAAQAGEFGNVIRRIRRRMATAVRRAQHDDYLKELRRLQVSLRRHGVEDVIVEESELKLGDTLRTVAQFVSTEIDLPDARGVPERKTIRWPLRDVCSSFVAFPGADSITVDPHKLGYVPYPCGAVAFKNDRVRLFVLQRAPYITATKHNPLAHVPPLHASHERDAKGNYRIMLDSFSPFILEGSKPGAAAAALWLAVRAMPLTMREHGAIIRSSLLSARELYERLGRWNQAHDRCRSGIDYEFIPLTNVPPDTNIVTFVVKKKTSNALGVMNALTRLVYRAFTIESELGDMEYSYSQPFFLSNTTMSAGDYPLGSLERLFERCRLEEVRRDYPREGVVVLRASVMSPYLLSMKGVAKQNLLELFVEELARATERALREL